MSKIMVTTHYPELKLYGYNRPRTEPMLQLAFDCRRCSPTYRLQIGIPGHSNAFAIAREIRDARRCSKKCPRINVR